MPTPQEYLSYIDGSGLSVRQRVSAAIYSEIERLHLPSHFDRQALAEEMTQAALDVFADSDDHGLNTPLED